MNRLELVDDILSCQRCELHGRCTAPVPFYGPVPAEIAILGEAPGRQEDVLGRPFVGPAGEIIRDALREVGVDPDSVAWVNTVSCWPQGTPTPAHVEACRPLKLAQLDMVEPVWVLMLGKVALRSFRPDAEIGKIRGRPFLVEFVERSCVGFPTYHPAAALRNRVMDKAMREDLAVWKKMVENGRERWYEFVPDHCSFCANPIDRVDEWGVGTCAVHS